MPAEAFESTVAQEAPLANPGEIKRFVFREVLAGDVLKFAAQSSSSGTGGGARDMRFRPYDKFDAVFERLLTGRKTVSRVRNAVPVDIRIYSAPVSVVHSSSRVTTATMEFEPPTTARDDEGRLTRLNHYGLAVPASQGRVMLLIWQTGDNAVRLAFATEKQLAAGKWHPQIGQALVDCFATKRRHGNAAQGFVDFVRGTRFYK